jgi:hypothetical protein
VPGISGTRTSTLQIRIEAFNLFNWVNLNNPEARTNNADFGKVTTVRGGTGGLSTGGFRVIQLAAKYLF